MAEKELKKNSGNTKDNKEETVTIPKAEYDSLKARLEEAAGLQDKILRMHAEYENARKRLEKDKLDFLKYANEALILELLPILDNLEIAEKHIKEAKDFKAVQEGVDMIQLQMQGFLKDIGVERIKTAGERFDPNVHDPIEVEDAKDKDDGLVLAELKPGYRFNGKLLRPALVKISKKVETK